MFRKEDAKKRLCHLAQQRAAQIDAHDAIPSRRPENMTSTKYLDSVNFGHFSQSS